MRFIHKKGGESTSGGDSTKGGAQFHQDTLIIPVVSTGNVGQLAVDLFLSSGRAQSPALVEKVGYLDTELVAPVAGYEVFGPGQPPRLCVNLELHRFASRGVTLLQQRGPVLPGEERAFARELVRWARESGFKDILALTGADAAEGLDPAPMGRAMKRFRAGTVVGAPQTEPGLAPCRLEEALGAAGIGVLDLGPVMGDNWSSLMAPMGGSVLDTPGAIDDAFGDVARQVLGAGEREGGGLAVPSASERLPPLPTGTGICGFLCKEASPSASPEEAGSDSYPPLVVVLHFCSEGDNIPHAVAMAEAVNSSLSILPVGDDETDGSLPGGVKWSSPLSWASLYGPAPDADAYC